MKQRGFVLALLGALLAVAAAAQSPAKQVTHQQLMWFTYANTIKLSSRWAITSEVHERRFINPGKHHQFVLRNQGRYALGDNWEAVAGFTYFRQSPNDPRAINRLTVPELRPHIQFNYRQPLGRFLIHHRYRAEKRFIRNVANGELAPGYTSNYRFRYRLGIDFLIASIGDEPLKLKVYDELHVNAGKNITYNRFDQNRLYAGLSYGIMKDIEVEAGYMNWYQQRSAGSQFYNRHILNFTVTHRIDLTKKREDKAE